MRNTPLKGMLNAASPVKQAPKSKVPKPTKETIEKKPPPPKPSKTYGFGITEPA